MRSKIHYYFFLCAVLAASTSAQVSDIHRTLADAALKQVGVTTEYTPGYYRIRYPGGDLPLERGVCSDVIIRAFRAIGVDLQKEVHEDMVKHFNKYPKIWNMREPDSHIDHRRVPNLMKYFQRHGNSLPLDSKYTPGDVVAWQLPHGLFHIGIVSMNPVPQKQRYYIIHNIGAGTQLEDLLYEYPIIGHYRW